MRLLNKLEKKWGKYAITNISLYLIICYGFGYLVMQFAPNIIAYLTLNPQLVLQGQVWRLFTWILIPPLSSSSNLFFIALMMFFYYSIGTQLERAWGTFYYNVYLFSGMIFTVLGGFLLYVLVLLTGDVSAYTTLWFGFSTYYINMSIFLGYASTYPNNQVLLMFIFPIKVKWLGYAYAAMMLFNTVQYVIGGEWAMVIVVIASMLNFIVFYLMTRGRLHGTASLKQKMRKHQYQTQVKKAQKVTRHKCAICGRTEENHPELVFRFCSKCDGNYEYCNDHIFSHEHIHKL